MRSSKADKGGWLYSGTLQPHSERSFASSASMESPLPVEELAKFSSDYQTITWERGGKPAVEAVRQDLHATETVHFQNGTIRLEGTLYLPHAETATPGIVLVHGSGKGSRRQLSGLAQFFASKEMAALTYDKRGCGGSGGDWRRSDFPELAQDALAGLQWLRAHPGVDVRRVGLYGISQGGWVVTLAASSDPDVAFFISRSGPGVSPVEQELSMLHSILISFGFSAEEISQTLDAYTLLYAFGKTGEGAELLDNAVAEMTKDPRLAEVAPSPSADVYWEAYYGGETIGDPGWFLHLDPDYDPVPAWRAVKCPALALYGELDWTVPVQASVAAIEGALKENHGASVKIKVLPQAGHGLPEVDPANPRSPATQGRVAPGLFETIEEWLLTHELLDNQLRP